MRPRFVAYLVDALDLSVLKKLSIGALSQALAFLLMDIVMPNSSVSARYCPLAY